VSKRRLGGRTPRPLGGDMSSMAQQLQKMRQEMIKAQEELAQTTLEVTAGGGMVTVVVTGHQRIESITLKPEVVNAEDIEMLQDMLVAAVNQALDRSRALAAERLEGLTSSLNLPEY